MLLRNASLTFALIASLSCAADIDGEKFEDGKLGDELGIIGGRTDNAHPYVVGVGDASGAFCTGTLISAQTVITAGHCFNPGATNGGITRIFFGTTLNGGSINVTQAIRHPNFNNNTLANDLAILKLATASTVQPAPLLRQTMANNSTFIGPDFTFVGYGVNNGTSQSGFGTKRVVTFPTEKVGPATIGGSATVNSIDATQFYYRVPGENTCNGDSGGPAFIAISGVDRHAGVTSFGDGPCTLDGVQQKTDVSAINGFIQPNINTFEPNNARKADGVCPADTAVYVVSGQVLDPDCQERHKGADGICAASATKPSDPDCGTPINGCVNDGICNASCGASDSIDCTGVNTGTVCGDGLKEGSEGCDDGNLTNGDGCSANCTVEAVVCGNGIKEAGEACDDGNVINGDGCSATCAVEQTPTGGFSGAATDTPLNVPDNNLTGVTSTINVPAGVTIGAVLVSANVSHTFRGDLIITLTAPNGQSADLTRNVGGSADNFIATNMDLTSKFTSGANAQGAWKLKVVDNAAQDTGTLNSFLLTINNGGTPGNGGTFIGQNNTGAAIPDNNTTGISSTIVASGVTSVTSVQVQLNITHTFRGDVLVTITNPAGVTKTVVAPATNDSADNIQGIFVVAGFTGSGNGNWTIKVTDKAAADIGSLVNWKLGLNTNL
jgi:cysteine-rich repeat protein